MGKLQRFGRRWMGGVLSAAVIISGTSVTFTEAAWDTSEGASSEAVQIRDSSQPVEAGREEKEVSVTQEQAVNIAEEIFDIPETFKRENISLRNDWYGDDHVTWELRWRQTKAGGGSTLSVSIDAVTGDVLRMHRYGGDEEAVFPPKVSRREAKEIAERFLSDVLPKKADRYILNEEQRKVAPPRRGIVEYTFYFMRTVNDIPFERDNARVVVNGNGRVVSYRYEPVSDVTFESPDQMMAQEEIEKRYRENLPLQLVYAESPGRNGEQRQFKLIYRPLEGGRFPMIDATSGALIDDSGHPLSFEKALFTPVSEEKWAEPPSSLSQPLTDRDVMEIVESSFAVPEEIDERTVEFEKNSEGSGEWNVQFMVRQNNSAHGWTGAKVDAETGRILSFSIAQHRMRVDEEAYEAKITWEQAKEKALEVLKDLAPDVAHSVYLQEDRPEKKGGDEPRVYHFHFQRIANDIPVFGQSVRISIAADTGEVIDYRFDWDHELDLPDPESAIDVQEAKESYLQRLQLSPAYRILQSEAVDTESMLEAVLVYERDTDGLVPAVFDAVGGEWINPVTGEALEQPRQSETDFSDIQGHWAEKELKQLVAFGVLQPDDGKIKPNATVSRGEAIQVLVTAITGMDRSYYFYTPDETTFSDVSPDAPYAAYVEEALEMQILNGEHDSFRPDEALTREELAYYLVRSLGYGKIAEVEDLFNHSFADAASIRYPGHVAIAAHLGILNGSEGKFYPQREVTRAELAVAVYRYLEHQAQYKVTP